MRISFSRLALALFITLGASQAYAYDCSTVPTSVSGDLLISEPGDCTITHDVSVSGGAVQIVAGGKIDAKAISAPGGNILLQAQGNIATDDLTTGNGSTTGAVQINANLGGGGGVFTIGGTGSSNGVNGVIDTSSSTGGGTSTSFITGGVFITNGDPNSTGGITVSAMSAISVNASSSRSGIIILNAQNGTLTLPAGVLDTDGASGQGAGVIRLLAKTLATADGTIISASQDSGAAGTYHGVVIAAETISVTGTSGLEIHADGNGVTSSPNAAYVYLGPQGSFSITSNDDPHYLLWSDNFSNMFYTPGDLTVSGTSAPFVATANGNDAGVNVTGYPVTFANGPVTIQSKGASNHQINFLYYGTFTASNGLVFSGNGAVNIDASGDGGDGGPINMYFDEGLATAPSISIKADGQPSGNGNGGTIYFSSSAFTLGPSSYGSLSANGTGTGNASTSAIIFYPGEADFDIGSGVGQFKFSAKGGASSGDGGNIVIGGYDSEVTVYGAGASTTPIDVSAPGTDGNGGKIQLTAYKGLTFDGTASYMKADSGTSDGDGGEIFIQTSILPLKIGTGTAGAVDLSAKGRGTGKGGTIHVLSYYGITADAAYLAVNAGTDGPGGTIILDAGFSTLSFDGDLDASGGTGSGNNKGGRIDLSGGYLTLPAMSNSTLTANGHDTGIGGDITVVSVFGSNLKIGAGNNELQLEATSDNTDGGNVTILADGPYGTDVTIDGASINVNAGTSGAFGNGGSISAKSNSGDLTITGNLTAYGFGTGHGGTITALGSGVDISAGALLAIGGSHGNGGIIDIESADDLTLSGTNVSVVPGTSGNGNGGEIYLRSQGTISLSDTFNASGQGTGKGGVIDVNADSGAGLTLSGGSTILSANGGGSGGDGGLIGFANAGGNITITSAAKLRASGGGNSSDGGSIVIQAGDASNSGDVSITASAEVEADSGLTAGNGGDIVVNYSGAGSIVTDSGIISADGATGPNGDIAFTNLASGGQTLNLSGSNTNISAVSGTISFNQSGNAINVAVSQSASPGPLAGKVVATGTDIDITAVTSHDLQVGNIDGTSSVNLQLAGTGDLFSAFGTAITTPDLTVGADGGSIGLTSPLLTVADSISPVSGYTQDSVNIRNDVALGTTTLVGGWEVNYAFYLYSTGSTNIGSITQLAGQDGSIHIEELAGALQIDSGAAIIANQGSIVIQVDTAFGGGITVGANADIAADANGSGLLVGNVVLEVGPQTTPSACGTIANFDHSLSSPTPICGPSGFTANSPTNYGLAIGRGLTIYSPNAGGITLDGGVHLNALN